MRSAKKLFYTTLALTLTGLIMRTVAVWFNVYLNGLIGTAGIGIFQLILSVYAMAKTLSYAGMNLAATRLCIDDFQAARHSMRRILICACVTGSVSFLVLYFGSNLISLKFIHTMEAANSLRALSFSLPFVSLSAGLNGYMTAARKMGRYSVIQLSEQICRIGATVALIGILGAQTQEHSLTLVGIGITISEVFSFSLCLITYLRDIRRGHMAKQGKKGFLKRFFRIFIPDAVGAYVRSGLNTVEHLLIPWGIRKNGVATTEAFSAYGIVQGMALPVVLYPSAILGVISSLLVPEIAECKAKNNQIEIRYMINRVLQVTTVFSLATAVVLFMYAEQLGYAVFHSYEAAPFLKSLSPLVPVMYMDMTTDGMLKGLDKQLSLMHINVLDSILCVILVYYLVPKAAVNGYIVTIYAAEIINFILSFRKLSTEVPFAIKPVRSILLPLMLAIVSFQMPLPILNGINKPIPWLIAACGIGCMIYMLLLRMTGCISKEDVRWAKKLVTPLSSSGSRSGASRLLSSFASDPE